MATTKAQKLVDRSASTESLEARFGELSARQMAGDLSVTGELEELDEVLEGRRSADSRADRIARAGREHTTRAASTVEALRPTYGANAAAEAAMREGMSVEAIERRETQMRAGQFAAENAQELAEETERRRLEREAPQRARSDALEAESEARRKAEAEAMAAESGAQAARVDMSNAMVQGPPVWAHPGLADDFEEESNEN